MFAFHVNEFFFRVVYLFVCLFFLLLYIVDKEIVYKKILIELEMYKQTRMYDKQYIVYEFWGALLYQNAFRIHIEF